MQKTEIDLRAPHPQKQPNKAKGARLSQAAVGNDPLRI